MPLVLYHEEKSVATINLNRPETFHSLNGEVMEQLMGHFTTAEENPAVRCVVLTASGKAFCSGQDLNEFNDTEEIDIENELKTRYEPLVRKMRSLPKPIICGLNGVAAGAGASLALACDMIVAHEGAYLSQAFIHIGLIPDGGATWFLPRIAGHHRAMSLMMTGDKVSAREAHEWGWVYSVFPPEEFAESLRNLAERMAQLPAMALAGIKQAVDASFQNTLDEQLLLERQLQLEAGKTEHFKEGVAAFKEKRRPEFYKD